MWIKNQLQVEVKRIKIDECPEDNKKYESKNIGVEKFLGKKNKKKKINHMCLFCGSKIYAQKGEKKTHILVNLRKWVHN